MKRTLLQNMKFFTDAVEAKNYIEKEGAPIVIKADGLAAGKGVIVAETKEQALETIGEIMYDKTFGNAGNSVVIEEILWLAKKLLYWLYDGETIIPMIPSQDHKRAYDSDKETRIQAVWDICTSSSNHRRFNEAGTNKNFRANYKSYETRRL